MLPFAERLGFILLSLRQAVAAFRGNGRPAYIVLLGTRAFAAPAQPDPFPPIAPEVWLAFQQRLGRLAARLLTLFTRWQQGSLPKPVYDRPAPPRPARRPGPPRPRLPALPRGHAWLAARIFEVRACATQLEALMAEPEFHAFLSAAPQAGRHLRPLCHMLGTPLPPRLAPPQRSRPPRSRPSRPPRPAFPEDRPLPDYVRRAARAWKPRSR